MLAAGAGLGVMATTTAGNVLAIQNYPDAQWDARVALLQRFVSAGQVVGLLAAGVLARSHPGTDSSSPASPFWRPALWPSSPRPPARPATLRPGRRPGR